MSTSNHIPLYEGDSLIHDAPRRQISSRGMDVIARAIDPVIALFRRLENAWVAGMERARVRRIEAMLEGATDVYEIERRLARIERNGWV